MQAQSVVTSAAFAKAGLPVTLIGRASHVDAIHRAGLDLDTTAGRWTIPVTATTDPAVVRDCRVVSSR